MVEGKIRWAMIVVMFASGAAKFQTWGKDVRQILDGSDLADIGSDSRKPGCGASIENLMDNSPRVHMLSRL